MHFNTQQFDSLIDLAAAIEELDARLASGFDPAFEELEREFSERRFVSARG